jgi:hypothetical protein
MNRRDIHDRSDFFEYLRIADAVPPAERSVIDVAVLDMNHSWPNLGHDSLVHALLDAAEPLRARLVGAGLKLRVLSFDVRRKELIPDSPNGRFGLYVGTGGPGHLDPRENDGRSDWSQGIREDAHWEAPLFRLFDDIVAHPSAGLIAVCHSFGLLCRWSGAAHAELRHQKSSGMPTNVLSTAAEDHPWFAKFASALPDRRHFRVVDNRLFDLVLDSGGINPIAFERDDSSVVTMAEFARAGSMPRVFGANHHPEVIDREHLLQVLEEKRNRGEVTDQWYTERSHTLEDEMHGDIERQSRLTSEYTLAGPLRFHVERLVNERLA